MCHSVIDSTQYRVNPRQRSSLVVTVGKSSNTPSQSGRSYCSWQQHWRVWHVEVPWAYLLVMLRLKMLCKIIGQVLLARMPLHVKRSIFHLVCDPKKSHFHSSGTLFFNCVRGNTSGCLIVTVHWCGWLFVSEFFEDKANYPAFLAIEEEGT